MAQMDLKLNNQMQNFYTSEILILPKIVNTLALEDQLEEKVDLIKEMVRDYLSSKKDFTTINNLSFFNLAYANFPIEEVRKMQVEAEYSASLSGQGKRVFVLLNFDSASSAAQNAALKIIEESPKDTLLLLLVSKREKILETITSRCLTIQLKPTANVVAKAKNIEIANDTDAENTDIVTENEPELFTWPHNYSQAIALAAQTKDRSKAINLLEKLLENKTLKLKTKQSLLRAYQDLGRNQNVQLVLENCFFSLVSLES